MSELDDIVREFLVESAESLDQVDRDFVALERAPGDSAIIGRIFRAIHTIKGTCGFLGFPELERLTHAGESLLARLRDGQLGASTQAVPALLAMVDAVRGVLAAIERTGAEPELDHELLLERLIALAADEPDPAAAPLEAPAVNAAQAPALADGAIRVDVTVLDRLVNLVGELVLARNQVLQQTTLRSDAALTTISQRLNAVTSELQAEVMRARMQPIGNLWRKFPRLVRDLALSCKKSIRLELEGEQTELDRSLLEAIKDPLTHLLRNAVDHGIETPDIRASRGKPREGRLAIRAYHQNGQVVIEVSDDGAGVDVERVRAKALERGLVGAEQTQHMGQADLLDLIFLPGFSTAEQLSNVSGRGVGMDVVRSRVVRIGGTIDIQTAAGEGTRFKLRIPLTLAIIPALLVTCAGARYALPQVNVLEMLRIGVRDRGIERIHDTPVYRLREQLLPLVELGSVLGVSTPSRLDGELHVVVVQAGSRRFGLVVDGIVDTAEIVVKPLDPELKRIGTYSGATILGDGAVALILDVSGVARRARMLAEGHTVAPEAAVAAKRPVRQLLLVAQGGEHFAVPLPAVSRLERIPLAAVEQARGARVTQHLGGVTPLVSLAELLGLAGQTVEPSDPINVIVCGAPGQAVGVFVERVLDIVEQEVTDGARVEDAPVVLGERVTELIDVGALLESRGPQRAPLPRAEEALAS